MTQPVMQSLNQPLVVITGAAGLVMSNAIPVLLEAGYRIAAIDRAFSQEQRAIWRGQVANGQVRLLETGDTSLDSLPLEHLLGDEPVDAVVHGAAVTASPEEASLTSEAHVRANLLPTLQLTEWAAAHGVRRTVLISSNAVYAATDGAVTEDQPLTPVGEYAVAKAAFEALAHTSRAEHERDVIAVRLSNIFGVGEMPRDTRPRISLIGRMIHEAWTTGTVHVTDEPARDWTFARDVGGALVALLKTEHLQHALYNVASKQQRTPSQIATALQTLIPALKVVQVPAERMLKRRGYLTNTRLREATGFTAWTPFEAALEQTVEAAKAALVGATP